MKKSFSMIELIFAIIIIAIAIGTLPKILEQSHEAIAKSVNQEVIWLSASKIHQILSFQWDENSMDRETNSSSFVLDVSGTGDNELERVTTNPSENNRSRIGHIKVNGITPDERRHFHKYYTIPINQRFASTIGVESPNDYIDIDDFDGKSEIINEESSVVLNTATGYKAKHQIDTSVFYIKDDANYGSQNITFTLDLTKQSSTTNIKLIESTITNCVTDDTVVLRAFSSNIGLYLYSTEE